MRLLFFSMHGGDSESMALICRGAGVALDFAGPSRRYLQALLTEDDMSRLRQLGAGSASDEEIRDRIAGGDYDGVIVATPEQFADYRRSLRTLNNRVPVIVHHTINNFALFRKYGVQNFISPSPRALTEMGAPNPLRVRKLVAAQRLPQSTRDPAERQGWASYVHRYEEIWPAEWKKFQELNRLLAPASVENYGLGSPCGIVDDLQIMRHSRATVHIKGGAICCYAIIRSMALGTPVVVDEETCDRCYLDGVDGLLIGQHVKGVADLLERLVSDDEFWLSCSETAARCASRQFEFSPELGTAFRQFVMRSQQLGQHRGRRLAEVLPPRSAASAGIQHPPNLRGRIMRRLLAAHAVVEPWVAAKSHGLRSERTGHRVARRTNVRAVSDAARQAAITARNRALFEARIEHALSGRASVMFVKVGAHDGVTGDRLHALVMRSPHWHGLLVEPVRHLCDRLEQNYSDSLRFTVANVAVARSSGKRRFYYVSPGAQAALEGLSEMCDQLGSFNKQHVLDHLGEEIRPYLVADKITCLSLRDLLKMHRIPHYDLIQIDTEGYDFEVLRQIDFGRHKPSCVIFEHKHLPHDEYGRARHLLDYHNYRLHDCGNDLLAVLG